MALSGGVMKVVERTKLWAEYKEKSNLININLHDLLEIKDA